MGGNSREPHHPSDLLNARVRPPASLTRRYSHLKPCPETPKLAVMTKHGAPWHPKEPAAIAARKAAAKEAVGSAAAQHHNPHSCILRHTGISSGKSQVNMPHHPYNPEKARSFVSPFAPSLLLLSN